MKVKGIESEVSLRRFLRRKSLRKTTAMSKVTPTREMKAKVARMRIRLIWICMTLI